MSMGHKISDCEYKASKEEKIYWFAFISCCMLASICMFIIAAIELNIG